MKGKSLILGCYVSSGTIFFFFVKVLINYSALLKILFVMFFYQVSRGVSARGLGFGMKDEGWKISEKNIEASGRVVDGGLHQ